MVVDLSSFMYLENAFLAKTITKPSKLELPQKVLSWTPARDLREILRSFYENKCSFGEPHVVLSRSVKAKWLFCMKRPPPFAMRSAFAAPLKEAFQIPLRKPSKKKNRQILPKSFKQNPNLPQHQGFLLCRTCTIGHRHRWFWPVTRIGRGLCLGWSQELKSLGLFFGGCFSSTERLH